MGQNPGIFDPIRSPHIAAEINDMWAKLADDSATPGYLKAQYQHLFGISKAAKVIGELVDDPLWLTSGRFLFTNAVRCTTPENQTPSEEMQENCRQWTFPLVSHHHWAGLITMGDVARRQLTHSQPTWNTVLRRDHQFLVCIKHYSSFRFHHEFEAAKAAVMDLFAHIQPKDTSQ